MTRGSAEIDSLFIDEGFGTLDQDSLEEVLDMLQHIQPAAFKLVLSPTFVPSLHAYQLT